VTWAHHCLLKNDRRGLIIGLVLTVILGMIFTALQAYEYQHAAFSYGGHTYGSTFFMATGFHGAHVIIGTIFLFVCLFRALAGDFTPSSISASGGGMVLALRRRRVAVPLRVHLRMGAGAPRVRLVRLASSGPGPPPRQHC
jgi:heme/copper-type cytochrome/quinol oxidase subunit 3